MNDKKIEARSSGGIGVCGLLGVLFVGLKLCNVIDWSWLWVTLPFWGPVVALGAVFILIATALMIAAVFDATRR